MKVTISDRYKRRSRVKLEKMIATNYFEGLCVIAYGLNNSTLYHDSSLSELEIAKTLLKGLE